MAVIALVYHVLEMPQESFGVCNDVIGSRMIESLGTEMRVENDV